MPYRHAWLFIAALIGATLFGFWRTYFGILPVAPIGFHIHGITASLWLLRLLAQSWTPHRRRIALHRALGRATFVAIPLFAAGAMGVVHSMAAATVAGDPFYALWGAPLGLADLVAFGSTLYAAGMALRHRRDVRLHAGYMLSTALPLLGPVLGRVVNQTVPGLMIHGPQDFPLFGWCVQLAGLIAALIALWLWRRDPRVGRPWAVMFWLTVVEMAGFATLSTSDGWQRIFAAIGTQPLALLMAIGAIAGVATTIAGWTAPATQSRARPATA